MPGHPDFTNKNKVERGAECLCHFGSNRNATARQSENNGLLIAVFHKRSGEPRSRFGPISKGHPALLLTPKQLWMYEV